MNSKIQSIEDQMLNSNIRLLSFDFFDTLAYRKSSSYIDFYIRLAGVHKRDQLYNSGITPHQFKDLRIEAERRAREIHLASNGNSECTIYDIYEQLVKISDIFKNNNSEILSNFEIKSDKENLIPALDLVDLINRLPLNITVCVVSDTFYPANVIHDFCNSLGIQRKINVFASSEHGCGKYSSLFAVLVQHALKYNINAKEILHLGDNYHSDVTCAHRHGLHAQHIPYGDGIFWKDVTQCEAYNRTYFPNLQTTPHDCSIKTLTARSLPRIDGYHCDETTYFEYGARNLGPIISGFTSWLHKKGKLNKIDKLLFLMREGSFLLEAYNMSRRSSDDVIPGNVLYISRRVVKIAAIFQLSDEVLRSFSTSINGQTIADYLDWLGILDNEVLLSFENQGYKSSTEVATHLKDIVIVILNNNSLRSRIESNAKRTRQSLLTHFASALGVAGDLRSLSGNIGLVDVGWSGSIQRDLAKIIAIECGGLNITGYYLSTTSGSFKINKDSSEKINIKAFGYLFNSGLPKQAHDSFMRSPEIVEQSFTSTNTGTLVDFSSDGAPITAVKLLPLRQREEIAQIQRGVLSLLEALSPYCSILNDSCDNDVQISYLRSLLLRVVCSPTEAEVSLFEHWVHDENLSSLTERLIINRKLEPWINSASPAVLSQLNMHECYWPSALLNSALRSSPEMRFAIDSHKDAFNLLYSNKNICSFTASFKGKPDFDGGKFNLSKGIGDSYTAELTLKITDNLDKLYINFPHPAIGMIWVWQNLIVGIPNEGHWESLTGDAIIISAKTLSVSIKNQMHIPATSAGIYLGSKAITCFEHFDRLLGENTLKSTTFRFVLLSKSYLSTSLAIEYD